MYLISRAIRRNIPGKNQPPVVQRANREGTTELQPSSRKAGNAPSSFKDAFPLYCPTPSRSATPSYVAPFFLGWLLFIQHTHLSGVFW